MKQKMDQKRVAEQGHASLFATLMTESSSHPPHPILKPIMDQKRVTDQGHASLFASVASPKRLVSTAPHSETENESEKSRGAGPCFTFCSCYDQDVPGAPAPHYEANKKPHLVLSPCAAAYPNRGRLSACLPFCLRVLLP